MMLVAIEFLAFSTLLDGFLSSSNLLSLVRSIAVLGILGAGLSIVVIARGIDLSIAAMMAVSGSWAVFLVGQGVPEWQALLIGLAFAAGVGAVNGLLVAFMEIPALFTTLASATILLGASQLFMVFGTVVYLPPEASFTAWLGQGVVLGIPVSIWIACAALLAGHFALARTRWGRFVYAMGDNVETARLSGIGIRPLTVAQYTFAACVAFAGGLTLVGANPTFSVRVAEGGILFDLILIVVLGGVSLSGGSGSIVGVLAGTLLIGIMLNGVTIMDLTKQYQDLLKGVVLLAAIIIDNALHPRDEETDRQSDI
ncbi:MAG: ABC transporter permease [Mesorhizobium sp.]|nr:ABC transporter permease [Mesorhizobium sp.]